METKTRKGPVKVITPAAAPAKAKAKNKNRYYATKAKAKSKKPAAKIEANKKLDGNLTSAKIAEKAVAEVVQPEPARFVWQPEEAKSWFRRLIEKLLPKKKKKFLQE